MLQFSIFIYVDIKERAMESVTSVITILTDFNRTSSHQLKADRSYLLSHCPLFIGVQCHGLFRFINISNTLLYQSICTFHFLCLRSSLPSDLTGDSVPSSERSSFPDNCPSYHHYPCPHSTALIFSMALIIMYLEWGVHDNSFVHMIFPALSTVSGT